MQNKILQFTNLCLMTSSVVVGLEFLTHSTAFAATLWDTLEPNSALAISSQSSAPIPSEAADDFFFLKSSGISRFVVEEIKFNGLFSDSDAEITNINVGIYQSFPFDSIPRNPLTPPVRANGPADDEFAEFDSGEGTLSFEVLSETENFSATETIVSAPNPNADPGVPFGSLGGGVTGELREISVKLTNPLSLLPAASPGPGEENHYFLAITVGTSSGDYYWVAGQEPPITPGDRQAWFRTEPFEPDWLRVSDIITGEPGTMMPAFNTSFQINGTAVPVPEPSTSLATLGLGGMSLMLIALRKRQAQNV